MITNALKRTRILFPWHFVHPAAIIQVPVYLFFLPAAIANLLCHRWEKKKTQNPKSMSDVITSVS